jgi:LPS export ABC transporter protein LptC
MKVMLKRVLFSLCSTALFLTVSCNEAPEKLAIEPEVRTTDRNGDLPAADVAQQLHGVRYSASKGERLQWELVAKTVAQMEKGPTNLEEVEITYYSDDGKVTVLKADEAVYDAATRNATVRGNIVITRSDGSTLKTETLRWNQGEEKLRGEGRVTIAQGRTIIKGRGFELSPIHETFSIFEVEGIIHEDDIEL